MEKSGHALGGTQNVGVVGRDEVDAEEVAVQNAVSLSPQGVPMQFAPAVVEL